VGQSEGPRYTSTDIERGQENYRGRGPEGHRPDYLSSFFRAAATGDGLESLVLLAILTRVGKPKIDIAIQAHVWVILGCCVERISIWRYPYFVHESLPFCGPGPGEWATPAGPFPFQPPHCTTLIRYLQAYLVVFLRLMCDNRDVI